VARAATTEGKVKAISISEQRGTPKSNVPAVRLSVGLGIEGDAHAGRWHRQLSLLGIESIAKMNTRGAEVGPGDFAENITTEGIDLLRLPVGTRLRLGAECEIEVTQLGKVCHDRCEIFKRVGDCIMPREGIFAKVLKGGEIRAGDCIKVIDDG